ncbi:hypothetical protein C0J52_21490 [Blattella germanica]|nr:hypothetical protein C0J52_21490 [Blattella germanica]
MGDKSPTSDNKLGRFIFKDDENEDIATGSLFAHRKDFNSSLRVPLKKEDAKKQIDTQTNTDSYPKKEVLNTLKVKGNSDTKLTEIKKTLPGKKGNKAVHNGSEKRNENSTEKKENNKEVPAKKPKLNGKPFGKLLEGVVLVISGYQNPHRGNLRNMALEMGARYKPDWDNTCTHLVCAFPNTPKFQQVWGKGYIVRKEWIENSHSKRKRLPWRRYALDTRDLCKAESEDEIPELVEDEPLEYHSEEGQSLSESDTEDEIEKTRAGNQQGDETDVDSDSDLPDTSNVPLPHLPNIFSGKCFYISDELNKETKTKLQRYIVALDGTLSDKCESDKVNIVISEKSVQFKPPVVRPEWVWECYNAERLLSSKVYEIC